MITLNQRWSTLVRLRYDATSNAAGCGTVRRHGPSTEPKHAVIRRESGESEMQTSVVTADVVEELGSERIMLRTHHAQVHVFSPTTGERLD